jgi:hypothetical protein
MSESSISLFQGMRGAGKTNAAMGEVRHVSPLFAIALRSNDWTWMQTFTNLKDFVYWAVSRNRPSKGMQIRFQFGQMDDYIQLFETMAATFQNSTIIIDEADAFYSVPKFHEPLNNLFLGSRNNNLNLYYMSKRPFLVPVLVRSQVDRFVIFKTEESRDIDYLSNRTRQQFPKDPFKLEVGEAIIIKTGQPPVIFRFPKFSSTTTVPSAMSVGASKRLITLKA